MDIHIDDDSTYYVNIEKVTDDIGKIYKNHIVDGLPLPNGHKIVFERKGLARLALKQIMTPFVIPALTALYAAKGEVLEKPEKHADLIDYCVFSFLSLIGRHSKDVSLTVTTQINDRGVKTVSSVATASKNSSDQRARIDSPPSEVQEED